MDNEIHAKCAQTGVHYSDHEVSVDANVDSVVCMKKGKQDSTILFASDFIIFGQSVLFKHLA